MAKSRKMKQIPLAKEDSDLFSKLVKGETIATCFFNNKGGVGKTTLVANLAAELSINFGAKVLVVDADPQCNVTQLVLGEEYSYELYSKNDPSTIYSILHPLSLGKGFGNEFPLHKSDDWGFDMIVGDPRLALQEDLLAGDWKDARGGGMRGIRTTFVFAELVKRAKERNYDFVFFDMGPSLGAINRSILLAMDFFIVPMAVDIFSIYAIRNIGATVDVWRRQLETGIRLSEDPSEILGFDTVSKMRFLGYVTQQHKERAGYDKQQLDDAGDEVKVKRRVVAYEEIGAQFPDQVDQHLGRFFDRQALDPHLGDIKHLGSLAPRSQSQHVPMISVAGTGSYTQLRKSAREIYRDIARRYLENLDASRL